jgi:hypothetical protein
VGESGRLVNTADVGGIQLFQAICGMGRLKSENGNVTPCATFFHGPFLRLSPQ